MASWQRKTYVDARFLLEPSKYFYNLLCFLIFEIIFKEHDKTNRAYNKH